MKKTTALFLSLALIISLATVCINADAFNPNGGCEVKFNVKKANPENVIKDGIIGENEYVELEVNRDEDTTDLLLSWFGTGMYEKSVQFLQNIHFYFSWDEVHGFNVGITAQHLEEIVQVHDQPADDCMSGKGETFPGDEFIASAGIMFRAYQNDITGDGYPDEVYYRGMTKRTDNGQYLIGYYYSDSSHGYQKNAVFEAEKNIYITYGDNNTVTYEMSIPLKDITVNGAVGDTVIFDLSVVGGSDSKALFSSGSHVYIVSIGDNGYCTTKTAATNKDEGYATITDEAIGVADADSDTRNDSDGSAGADIKENDNATPVSDGTGDTEGTTTEKSQNGGDEKSAKTGDITVVLIASAMLSACGCFIEKKKKRH